MPNIEWYDFICPFCYIAQDRADLLEEKGIALTRLPFEVHPEIPAGEGKYMGPRQGPMYEQLEREAKLAGLPLNWPDRLPNSRLALSAAEWLRVNEPEAFKAFHQAIFAAHFANGEDIGALAVLQANAKFSGASVDALTAALESGAAEKFLKESENLARSHGVSSTPSWRLDGQILAGLMPREELAEL